MIIPATGMKNFVESLAAEHGVSFTRSSLDDLADTFTRLSDDEVQSDSTQDLIVELKRANVISASEMVLILGKYIEEKGKENHEGIF